MRRRLYCVCSSHYNALMISLQDKVCSDVTLPLLSRDDWLVFTDLSPNLTGTCFNGFSAPDVAYCVLGDYGV